jgi:polysaccharide export outer membrane protein
MKVTLTQARLYRIAPLALLIGALIILSACFSPVRKLAPLATDTARPYLLGPGDELQITIFGDTDLTGAYKVSDSGTIAMSVVGLVPAQGLSLSEFQERLIERLKARAIKSPDVAIQLAAYRPFFILGEVKNPGSYVYIPNMTVLTAVALAGGFTFRAAENDISVTRVPQGERRATRSSPVLPGDVIYVFERHL